MKEIQGFWSKQLLNQINSSQPIWPTWCCKTDGLSCEYLWFKIYTRFTLKIWYFRFSRGSFSEITILGLHSHLAVVGAAKNRTSKVVLLIENLPTKARDWRDVGWIPGSGRSPGGEHGNPLQYPWLENLTDRGTWQATVYRSQRAGHGWTCTGN